MERQPSFWIRHLESLPKVVCPRCEKEDILLARKPANRFYPSVSWFQKRTCPHCKYPWTDFQKWRGKWLSRKALTWRVLPLVVLSSAVFYLFYLTLFAPYHPVDSFKTLVRWSYDRTYRSQSRHTLWRHWGWLYREKDSAKTDYASH